MKKLLILLIFIAGCAINDILIMTPTVKNRYVVRKIIAYKEYSYYKIVNLEIIDPIDESNDQFWIRDKPQKFAAGDTIYLSWHKLDTKKQ